MYIFLSFKNDYNKYPNIENLKDEVLTYLTNYGDDDKVNFVTYFLETSDNDGTIFIRHKILASLL